MTEAACLGVSLILLTVVLVGYFIRYGSLDYSEDMWDPDDPFPDPKDRDP